MNIRINTSSFKATKAVVLGIDIKALKFAQVCEAIVDKIWLHFRVDCCYCN